MIFWAFWHRTYFLSFSSIFIICTKIHNLLNIFKIFIFFSSRWVSQETRSTNVALLEVLIFNWPYFIKGMIWSLFWLLEIYVNFPIIFNFKVNGPRPERSVPTMAVAPRLWLNWCLSVSTWSAPEVATKRKPVHSHLYNFKWLAKS